MNSEEAAALRDKYLIRGIVPRDPLVIDRASGLHIYDLEGNRYTDLFSGISTNNLGHCHPDVVRAVAEQAGRFMHVSGYYTHPREVELAKSLVDLLPRSLCKVFFCNSGTEAVDGAVKLAKKTAVVEGRQGSTVIALKGSFHGRLSLTLTLTGQRKYKARLGNYANYPGVVHAPCPYHYRYGGGLSEDEFGLRCADEVAEIIDHYASGDVAAVLVEPILGEGGIIVPPDTYLPRLEKICSERGVPLVVDEVQTGFGRTGKIFASEHWGLKPDLMAMAKALGAGLPLGAIAVSERVDRALEPGDHFNTFMGNPVSCAAALAGIRVLTRDRLHENAARQGASMIKHLREAMDEIPFMGDVRGRGLMVGVELVWDERTKKPAPELADRAKAEMRRRGYLIGVGGIYKNVLRIQPPLIITEEVAQEAVENLVESIKESAKI
ncbi:5-aminovalerate aminotransferase DavT [archaeon HR01]|nr:5-aminovalerate aminotransferase DavT [archaeon HR01]